MDCDCDLDETIYWKSLDSKRNIATDVKNCGKNDIKNMATFSPSEYIQQISLNPENIACNIDEIRKMESAVFTSCPKTVVFSKFEIGNVYRISLNICNTSQYPHYIKLLKSDNVVFNVTFKGSTLNTRLAPGMTLVYDVEFRPDEKRDYSHHITFKTDTESFTIPVIAIGPRALLSFPDEIDMERTAVKVDKTKPILMRNIGDRSTGFSIFTNNPSFTVTPSRGSLEIGEAQQVQINFTPAKTGISNGYVFLRYECGDTVRTVIYGEAEECDVRVLNENIVIENTYLGLSRQASIEIQNNSDYILSYEWVKYKSIEEDLQEKERRKQFIDPMKSLFLNNKISPSAQELIRQRIYSDNIESLTNESIAFCDTNFNLFPMKGEIWPRNLTNVSVTFIPNEVNDLFAVAYLEIKGLENRIPVSLAGKCIGPALELNLLSLDVQQVYLCSNYDYEIVCKNDGPISGTLKHVPKDAVFGSKIIVEPSEIKIDIDEFKSMKLSFCSDRTGHFVERVDFVIKESSEVLSLVMNGAVICPLVRVDSEEIDFPTASIGFTMQKQLCFRNLSHTPIDFNIRALDDGYEDPVTFEEFARAQTKPAFPICPREFLLSPSEGTVEPQKLIRIQLFYTPNAVRSEDVLIQVCLCKSPNAEPLLIPVNCRAKSTTFEIDPTEVNFLSCFVNFPYCKNLVIKNSSDVEGYFYIIPQKISVRTTVLYSLSTYQGYLKSGESKEIILTVIVKTIEQEKITLRLLSLGLETSSPCCEITCSGQGPLVSVEPSQLHWGEIQLLRKEYLTLELRNNSPISAEFFSVFSKKKSVWEIEPASAQLEANESITLNVSVLLRDKGKHSDHMFINIINGETIDLSLSATGIGTCIVFDPEILPEFDMGFLFSKQDISIPLTIKNDGNKHHYILLTNIEKARQIKKLAEEVDNKKFKIEPNIFELQPGLEKVLQCKIRWNANEKISEKWYIYATIDGQGKRELVGTSTFKATFIEPNVIFSKHKLTFRLDIGYNHEMMQQENELQITNHSGPNLNAHITIEPPFFIIDKCNCYTDNLDAFLNNEEMFTLKICFPFDIENSELVPQKYDGYIRIEYDEHKQIDTILCTAEVNFPHLVFASSDINLYCIAEYSSEKRVKVINDSPLPVFYKIKWLKESFAYQSLSPVLSKTGSEEMISKGNSLDNSLGSLCSPKYNNESNIFDILKIDQRESSYIHESNKSCEIDDCECAEVESEKSSSEHNLFSIELLERFLQITPEEGQISPYTEQFICFTFNGYKNVKVSAQAICEITCGSSQVLNVTATADTVRCRVEDSVLDYEFQLYCETSVRALKVMNQCTIPLSWSIETSSDILQVMEGPQMLEPVSENLILVDRKPSAPGLYNEKLFLKVTQMEPFVIDVKWLATMPQIYLDVSRNNVFEKYPIEFGYQAVQLVMAESSTHGEELREAACSLNDSVSEIEEFSEYEKLQLIDDNWNIIAKEEKLPSQIDIDMAFERVIVRDYMQTNKDSFIISNIHANNDVESCLYAPVYIVKMGFVVVDQTAQISISLRNYGYEKAKVKLKKDDKKKKFIRSCFHVQFQQNIEICQCENSKLNVIFNPKKDMFTQKRSDVSYKFYLEVKNGLTIPVHVKAAAVYPYITVSAETLNFENVFIGDCKEMSFLLKNDALVECQWKLSVENTAKNSTNFTDIFYVKNINGVLNPAEETIIKVYFRPYKNGSQDRNLTISVEKSQEIKSIKLIGCGIERKVKISKMNVKFPPVLPNTTLIEALTIENNNPYPIELYWQHLINFSEINTIIRVLKHYYARDEILIPKRKINENISPILIEFYYSLVYEMSLDNDFKNLIKNLIKVNFDQKEMLELSKTENEMKVKKTKKGKSVTDLKKSNSKLNVEKPDYTKVMSALDNNPHEIETLLHAYITKLHKDSNFFQTMKDPLTDLHEIIDRQLNVNDTLHEAIKIEKNLIIIFYGAPFTEYQEVACQTAKSLNLPLLNLNQIFLEALAFSQSESVKKLADQIDNRYNELTTKLEKIKNVAVSSKKQTINVYDKVVQVLKKLVPREEIEKMDLYSNYEHKLEIIALILSVIESLDSSTIFKGKHKISAKDTINKRQSILPGVSNDLFRGILQDSVSQLKFKNGYVLQTLNNEFIKNETTTLNMLLEATGKSKFYLFVTFFNSYELYERRYQRINQIDEEGCDEIIQISENGEEIFQTENNQEKPNYTKKSKKVRKKSSFLETDIHVADMNLEEPMVSKEIQNTTMKKMWNMIPESDKIMKKMKEYENNLSKLLEVISEWEYRLSTAQYKNIKRTSHTQANNLSIDTFFIWHFCADDPWDKKIYEAFNLQVLLNFKDIAKNASNDELSTSLLPSRTYTILKEYEEFSEPLTDQIFILLPEVTEVDTELSKTSSDISIFQLPHTESQKSLEARLILQPRESRKFKLKFRPTEEGIFKGEFILGLVENADTIFKIKIEGVADVPKLNMTPDFVFDKVKSTKVNNSHEPTYFLDAQTYDFGSLLISNTEKRIHKKGTNLMLRNISNVSAIVSLTLENENIKAFDIHPRKIKIEPNKIESIAVTAYASKLGVIVDTLILSIQNSECETIQLRSNGIELKMEINPRQINLDRVLLYRTENQKLKIKNGSEITIYWHLSTENNNSPIRLSCASGKIKHNSSCDIEIQYYADKVVTTHTNFLNCEIFLNEKDRIPIETHRISVTAQNYELLFNVETENPIDFKAVPVGSINNSSFAIKNLGKYDIGYEIQYQDKEILKKLCDANILPMLEQDFKIYPTAGLIQIKKQTIINIIYTPTIETTLKSFPLFNCEITEPYKGIGLVSKSTINVSAISYYTRFSIEPQPQLNFGTVALKTPKTMQLKIKNTGKFRLKFSIINQSTARVSQVSSVKKRDSKAIKKDKIMPKKEKITTRQSTNFPDYSLKWGPFTLEKMQGELEPGQSDTLVIHCCSDTIGHFEERVTFLIPDSLPADECTRQVSVIADICIAEIDFNNYKEIFAESYVVESIENFDYPNEIDAHTIFEKCSKCLHFNRVCIGNTHVTSITLRNTSVVHGDVIIGLISNSTNTNAFTVDTNKLTISPMSKQSLKLFFTPTILGNFSSSITIKLDSPSDIEPQTFAIELRGVGHVPQICIISPATTNNDISVLDFGLSSVSDLHEKIIKIQNVGQVKATITVEIFNDLNTVFSIHLDVNEDKLSCGCSNDENGLRKVILQLFPEEIRNVKIHFVPMASVKYKSCLKILIENNPYEILKVNMMGEGLNTSIVLENLEIVDTASLSSNLKTNSRESTRKLRKNTTKHSVSVSRSNSKILTTGFLSYKLDYGISFLNRMKKINFKIRNKTKDRYFKFEWTSHPNLVCVPASGHLAPDCFKELSAMFLAWEPISLNRLPLQCTVCEIVYNNQSVESCWDSRQTNVNWIEKQASLQEALEQKDIFVKKIVVKTLEPEFQAIPETMQSMQLLISAFADYSDYFCDVEMINFDDTLMLQAREHKFSLKNTGLVNLDYSWELTMDEHYPIRLDQAIVTSTSTLKSNLNKKNNFVNEVPTVICRESKRRLQMQSKNYEESCEPSDLFSSSAGLTDRSTDSWIEGENWPFEITPKSGSLAPNEVSECVLKFLPVDVFEYKAYLRCKMENLNPNKAPPNIIITAKSLLPYCHFEIKDSDYLANDRRDITLPGPPGYCLADPETKNNIRVVEFKMMGTGTCHTGNILLVNPTSEDYCFRWSRLSNEIQNQSVFQCLPRVGVAEKGKRCKISFSHIAEKIGLFESFWQFEIKKYNIKTLFLVVANVVEPSVKCLTKIMKMEPFALGEIKTLIFEVINKEDCPLHFDIIPDTLYSEKGRLQSVKVYPMSDFLKPNSSQIFNVEYKSSLIGEHSFDIRCKIENLSNPISIFINFQVVKLVSKVVYIDEDHQEIEMIKNCENIIDIGQLMLREPKKVKFGIINNGPLDFEYSWILNSYDDKCKLTFSENNNTIKCDSSSICYLEIIALEKTRIHNIPIILQIKYGPTYRLKLNGSAKKFPIEFSFSCFDFGPCYVQTQEGYLYTTELDIKNNQKYPCSIKCNFEDKPHLKLDLSSLPYAIPAKASAKIIINFRPMEEIVYREKISLLIRDMAEKEILIQGEGIPYKIRLKDPCEALIDFGTVTVDKTSCQKICLINEGRLPIKMKVSLRECFSESVPSIEQNHEKDVDTTYLQPLNSLITSVLSDFQNVLDSTESSELAEFIEISPTELRHLKPNKEAEVTVKCKAVKRIRSLTANLSLEVDNSHFHLALIKANCVKANFYLSRTYVSFGAIFEGCTSQEKLVLINDGDISIRFNWKIQKIISDFEIMPISGICSAGSEITFTCTFKPSYPTSCIKTEATLEIKRHTNLTVTFTGDCRPIPESKSIINFSTQIGQSQTKQIEIQNDSDRPWTLTPILIGDYFTMDENLFINSKTNSLFSITYKPLKKALQEHIDKGKVVIILPNGRQPIVHELSGSPSAAKVSEKRTRTIPAKRRFVETLVICNSSNEQQTFNCKTEELLHDTSIITHKFEQIDVNANSQANYAYSFSFDSEGHYIYEITIDDNNGNIKSYEFFFTVTSPEVVKVIELTTYVRCPVLYNLQIENPSKVNEVRYNLINDNEDIVVHGLPTTLAPSAFQNVQIEYLPLLTCETNTMLEIMTEVFGSIFYELHLTAKASPPEKTIHVKSILGNSVNFRLRLKNYSKRQCEFHITVDKTTFSCPKYITIPPHETSTMEVQFEPDCLETVNTTVTATSLTAGKFVFPVVGLCSLPQPQGPFAVTKNASTVLSFRNAFNEKKAFNFTVDNPNFVINRPTAMIEPKEETNIFVSWQDSPRNSMIAGKLTITSTDQALSGVKWIYYLKGVTDE